MTGDAVAREALVRVGRIFDLDAAWKDRPPNELRRLRQLHSKPHLDAFFEWVHAEYSKVEKLRGLLRDALGYVVRQRAPLSAFLANGRLQLTNNGSERELRAVAVGRKAWLFCGSDGHAASATELMSLIASARLHKLDPELYLRQVIRAVPHWPRDRYLELTPKHWAATLSRLNAAQLSDELGPLDVPDPAQAPPSQECAAD